MEDVGDPQLKRERPSPYNHPPPPGLHHMPPAETSALHNYHQAPPPGAQMPPQWNPTPSPYHENSEHRPHHPDHPPHSHPYPPQHYAPPPPGHVVDPSYSRHGSLSASTRSPPNPQQPQYPPPLVNGVGPEPQYYQQQPPPPPDYRGRQSYGPPEGQSNGTHPPPLHVTTSHEMMPGQPQSAPPLNHGAPYSGGPPPGTPYPWGGYDVYPRRKPVRAAQACDPCRQRKAKCDEGRPSCTHCKDNQLQCIYRDVPPQKAEKQVLAITDELKALSGNVEQLMDRWTAQEDRIGRLLEMQEAQTLRMNAMAHGGMVTDDHNHSRSKDGTVKASRVNQFPKQERRGDTSSHTLGSISLAAETPQDSTAKKESTLTTSTAAADLLSWPMIKQLIPKDQTASYVMDTESERGLLRLYGCGEGEDRGDGHDGAPSPSTSTSSGRQNEEEITGLSPTGVWGTGQFTTPSHTSNGLGPMREHSGGLGPNGGLHLDANIVEKYYNSYLDNMHKLHPFLDTRVLRKMVYTFKRKYSWDFISESQRMVSNVGGKRKREISGSPNSLDEYNGAPPVHRVPPRNLMPGHAAIEHSVANAIILLVLALGKVCAYKDPLPGPVTTSSIRTSTPHALYSDLPMSASAPTSPYTGPTNTNGMLLNPGPANPQGKNMDVIPGLAYFTKAADILGEMPGGVDVSHVQANLLAGLYMGQLARILPSHWYIGNACKACQIIIQSTPYRERRISKARRNLINFAFWSCLQLESDILAEVEIPASGIVSKEASMFNETPETLTLADPERGDPTQTFKEHRHYLYQIQLRRTINDALKYLYHEDRAHNKPPETVVSILGSNLEDWRQLLGDWDWDDDDHESKDINEARMRGKYYGAKYIIHRPALYWALNYANNPLTPASRPSQSPVTGHGSEYSSSPALQNNFTSHPAANRKLNDMRPPPMKTYEPLDEWILEASAKCVNAAIRSTTAFDKVPPRLIITNVFGTAHAQFGNILILSATFHSTHPQLRALVDDSKLRYLMDRTIMFLQKHEAISPTLGTDARILKHVQGKLFPPFQPGSAASSFSSR